MISHTKEKLRVIFIVNDTEIIWVYLSLREDESHGWWATVEE